MKIKALIIQNKKGVNVFVISSNTFPLKLALHYSRSIYEFIIKQFKTGKKIERSFLIDTSITCICNITKEYIIACLISNYRGIFAGYDALKKANDLFKQYSKNNMIERKFPEFFNILDEFLYTREFRLNKLNVVFSKSLFENRPNSADFPPLKKIADCEVFDKFQHVNSELEKNMIANIPLKYAKKQLTQDREDRYVVQIAEFPRIADLSIDSPVPLPRNCTERRLNYRFAFKCNTVCRKKDSLLKRSSGYDFKKNLKQVNVINNNVSYVGFSNEEFKRIIKGDVKGESRSGSMVGRDNEDLIDLEYTKTSISGGGGRSISNPQITAVQQPKFSNAPNIDLLNDDIIENPEDIRYSRPSGTGSFVDQNNFDMMNSTVGQTRTISNASNEKFVIQRTPVSNTNVDLLIFDDNEKSSLESTPKTSFVQLSISLKLLEKTIITLQNGKIKELKIFGQLLIEGETIGQKLILKLLSPIWEESTSIQKRVTPNSLVVNQIGTYLYEIVRDAGKSKSRSVFDYIVASKHFKIERIPLMVIYKSLESERQKNDNVLGIQYKVNESPDVELKDVEIEVILDSEAFFEDIQTLPNAFSFQNHVLLWKLGDLKAGTKGKLQLVVTNCNKEHSKMMESIRIIFTVKYLVMDELDAEINLFPDGATRRAERKSIYEYKIIPNS